MVGWLFCPVYMGPLYHTINAYAFGFCLFQEMSAISRSERKDNINFMTGPALEWSIFFLGLYWNAPRIVFRKRILENSGLTEAEYPMLYDILFTHRQTITAVCTILILLWFCLSLQKTAMRY